MKLKSVIIKSVRIISMVSLVICLQSPSAFSQAGRLSLDHVDGIAESDSPAIRAGVPITFYIRFTNAGPPNEDHVKWASNGFKV